MQHIAINNLQGDAVIRLSDPGEPPPTLTVTYPGDPSEAPEGTVSFTRTAVYLNANMLPADLRKQCVQYFKNDAH